MLFDSTLRKDLFRSFGAALVVLLTIVLTMALIRMLGLAAQGRVSPQDVVLLLGYTALGQLPIMLTLSMFIAVVASLSRMYRDSEMAVWFSSGVGLTRFVRPVLRTAAPVLVVTALLVLIVWPWVNRQSAELRDRFERRGDLSRVTPGQFQTSSDGQRTFFIERDSGDAGAARNVFILSQRGGTESVTTARTGRLEYEDGGRYLVLDRGQRNDVTQADGERALARFESYRVLAGERVTAGNADLVPRMQPTLFLLHDASLLNRGELSWRLGVALGGANLVLLGIGLSATNPRRAGSWNLLFALLGFVVYYNVINLSQAWVGSGKLSLGPALLLAHGSAFLLAVSLLWWRDQRHRWRRPALIATRQASDATSGPVTAPTAEGALAGVVGAPR